MFDYQKIHDEVTDCLGEWEKDYDVDGIMDELRAIEPEIQSITDLKDEGDLTDDVWIELIQRHDVSGE